MTFQPRLRRGKPRSKRWTLASMAWRSLVARPARTLLTLLGIALGVGAILATNITNRNVAYTLDRLFERALGGTELQVIPSGNRNTISASVLEVIQRTPGVSLAVPLVRTTTVPPGYLVEGSTLQGNTGVVEVGRSVVVEGIDPVLEPQMKVYTLAAGRFPSAGRYEALIPETFASQYDQELGGELLVYGPEGTVSLVVTGLLVDEGAALTNSGSVVFIPIDVIREIFSLDPGYSEINIKAREGIGDDPQALAELRSTLEDRIDQAGRVTYPSARSDQVPRMASAYQFVLAFFSIITLFMGAFLIYNTFATSVLERTQEIGMLRALGMQRPQVMGQVLTEAAFLSLLGCLLGLGAGLFLSRGLMSLMRGFFLVEASSTLLTPLDVLSSVGIGLVGTFLATLLPARQAARITPVEALTVRARASRRVKAAVWIGGFILLAAGWGLLHLPVPGAMQVVLVVRMAAFVIFLLGAVLTVPLALTLLEPLTRHFSTWFFGVMGTLGARNVKRAVARTMVTVASLAIALIMIIEVNSLVHVLKQDVSDWLDTAVGADVLVRAPYPMRQSFARSLEAIPGVQAASPSRLIQVQVARSSLDPARQQEDTLNFLAIDPALFLQVGSKDFVSGQGDPTSAWALLGRGNALFVSGVVAEEYGLQQGDHLDLLTHRGQQAFLVAGVVTEFDQNGMIVTGTYADLRRLFGESGADLFSLRLSPGYVADEVAGAIIDRFEKSEGIQVLTTQSFKQGVMTFYNNLTSLFNVLSWVGVIIGTMGLFNTMTMNVLERTRELGILRAIGCLRLQVVRMVLAEAMIIGIVSALYGTLFGYLLSRVLVSAANLISGYDLNYSFDPNPYLVSLLIALGVSQVAAFLPSNRAARVNMIQAIKHE